MWQLGAAVEPGGVEDVNYGTDEPVGEGVGDVDVTIRELTRTV